MIEIVLLALILAALGLGLLFRFPVQCLVIGMVLVVLASGGCATDHRTSEQKYRDLKAAEQAARREQWQLRRFR